MVVIAQGRLRHASPLAELRSRALPATYVESPRLDAMAALAAERGWPTASDATGLLVEGASAAEVGGAAYGAGIELHQLVTRDADIEAIFFELTKPEGEQ